MQAEPANSLPPESVAKWATERDEPEFRRADGMFIYKPTRGLLGLEGAALIELAQRGAGSEQAAVLQEVTTIYRERLASELAALTRKYQGSHWLFWRKNSRFLLWQYISDINSALNRLNQPQTPETLAAPNTPATSQSLNRPFHALTAEYNMLCHYIRQGQSYTEKLKPTELASGTTRYASAPDNHLTLFVSGFKSNWQSAVREAYATCYKLGYALEDIYIFNYKPGATQPLRLADFMDTNARFVGKYKILAELEKAVTEGLYQNDLAAKLYLQSLRLDPDIARFNFSEDENMSTAVLANSQALAIQLHYVRDTRGNPLADPNSEDSGQLPQRKLNLIAQSQGGAVAGGFLLQVNEAGNPIFDEQLKQFVAGYALLISAHAGAYLAQTARILIQTKPLLYKLIRWAKPDIVASRKVEDLALDSPFTQASYTRLYSKDAAGNYYYNPWLKEHLKNHAGIEIYAANDDVTTSVPLAALPSTQVVRLIGGRHQEIIIGEGPNAGNRANRYLWLFFKARATQASSAINAFPRNYESDRLLLAAYLKRGLPDYDIVAYTKGFMFSVLRFIFRTPQSVIYFLIGESGIVDYPVYRKVRQDNNESIQLAEPAFIPLVNFEDFLRGD